MHERIGAGLVRNGRGRGGVGAKQEREGREATTTKRSAAKGRPYSRYARFSCHGFPPSGAWHQRRRDGVDPSRAQGDCPHTAEDVLAEAWRRRRDGKARKLQLGGHAWRRWRRRRICPRGSRGASEDRTWLKGRGAIWGVRNARGGSGTHAKVHGKRRAKPTKSNPKTHTSSETRKGEC